MWDQALLEPAASAMDASSNGEKTLPGTQLQEPQAPITVRGIEKRSLVLLQASQRGHLQFQTHRVEELTAGLTMEIRGDHVLLDTVFQQAVNG